MIVTSYCPRCGCMMFKDDDIVFDVAKNIECGHCHVKLVWVTVEVPVMIEEGVSNVKAKVHVKFD